MKKIKKKVVNKIRGEEGLFDVIKLFEKDCMLFDCIPDNWYVHEDKSFCFWPPTKGKSVAIRALKREKPDETWEQYQCVVVKEGFGEFKAAEKCVHLFLK